MRHLILCLALCFSLAVIAPAQSTSSTADNYTTVDRMRQLDLLNQILPLVLKKDQILKLLPVVEKARGLVKTVERQEAADLAALDPQVRDAVNNSIKTGVPPDKKYLEKIAGIVQEFRFRRVDAVTTNVSNVMKVFKEVCDAGQIKAAQNSLAMQMFDPGVKPDQVKDDDKLRFFIREIFLDPLAYDILVKLSK